MQATSTPLETCLTALQRLLDLAKRQRESAENGDVEGWLALGEKRDVVMQDLAWPATLGSAARARALSVLTAVRVHDTVAAQSLQQQAEATGAELAQLRAGRRAVNGYTTRRSA
jgi:hypothetical protein